jgi:hypothetical protein
MSSLSISILVISKPTDAPAGAATSHAHAAFGAYSAPFPAHACTCATSPAPADADTAAVRRRCLRTKVGAQKIRAGGASSVAVTVAPAGPSRAKGGGRGTELHALHGARLALELIAPCPAPARLARAEPECILTRPVPGASPGTLADARARKTLEGPRTVAGAREKEALAVPAAVERAAPAARGVLGRQRLQLHARHGERVRLRGRALRVLARCDLRGACGLFAVRGPGADPPLPGS